MRREEEEKERRDIISNKIIISNRLLHFITLAKLEPGDELTETWQRGSYTSMLVHIYYIYSKAI